MSFYCQYPASASGSNPSIGTPGAPVPSYATVVAGENPTGDVQIFQTDAIGNLLVALDPSAPASHVIVDSSALPTGAATAANQTTGNTSLASINTRVATETTLQAVSTNTSSIALTLTPFSEKTASALVSEAFDYQLISYVPSGNGVGEIQTVVYKLGGASGTLVATLTMAYDAQNRLQSVTRS